MPSGTSCCHSKVAHETGLNENVKPRCHMKSQMRSRGVHV